MKYHNSVMKGSQDIEWTSSGLPTNRPTGAKQYALFFEGGIIKGAQLVPIASYAQAKDT
jgi:hypothetical protein